MYPKPSGQQDLEEGFQEVVLLRVTYVIPHYRSFPSKRDSRGKGTEVEEQNSMRVQATALESGRSLKGRGCGARAGSIAAPRPQSLLGSQEALSHLKATDDLWKDLCWPWQEAYWEEVMVIQARNYKGLNNSNGSVCGTGERNPRTA